jgi:hypothetical protein
VTELKQREKELDDEVTAMKRSIVTQKRSFKAPKKNESLEEEPEDKRLSLIKSQVTISQPMVMPSIFM